MQCAGGRQAGARGFPHRQPVAVARAHLQRQVGPARAVVGGLCCVQAAAVRGGRRRAQLRRLQRRQVPHELHALQRVAERIARASVHR